MLDTEINQLLVCASFGWHIVPLYGMVNGRCECGNDHVGSESSRGKHPRGKLWQDHATTDEDKIIAMFENYPNANAGLLLGPRSGVIDVEFDGEDGRATADRIFKNCITPSYRSGRSVHRLFKWSPELPDVNKRIVEGLEVRIGGGAKAAQSVLPPSTHYSGSRYTWLAGLSPHEVEPAELPRSVLAMLFNDEGLPRQAGTGLARLPLSGEKVLEGNRDNVMLAFASRFAHRSPRIDDPQEQVDLWRLMNATNSTEFEPPLDDGSMKRIHQQAIRYARQNRANGIGPQDAAPDPTLVVTTPSRTAKLPPMAAIERFRGWGLEQVVGGGWEPGPWRMEIVLADPVEYRLVVPAWADYVPDGVVKLDSQQIDSADGVAKAVRSQTKRIVLNSTPRLWPSIWNGTGGQEGLYAQLMYSATEVAAPSYKKILVAVAEYLVEYFESAAPADPDNDKPDEYGPKYRCDATLWFRFEKAWHDAFLRKLFSPEDVGRLFEILGIDKERPKRWVEKGKRLRYYAMTPAQLARLEAIAIDDDDDDLARDE